MKTYLTILGCGSSLGVPRADGYWGKSNPENKKNYRTRCSIAITKGNNTVLIDTSPDLRLQLIENKIKNISYVLYTHEHADQTHGINDLRPFFFKDKKKINIYASPSTLKILKKSFSYCFKKTPDYLPFLKANKLKSPLVLGKKKERIKFSSIIVRHGKINSIGYLFNKVAYISDCNKINNNNLIKLNNLNLFIIDCLRIKSHSTHFNYDSVMNLIKIIRPKQTILTNLHFDLDYNYLLKKTPTNVKPAFDGMKLVI